MKIFTDSYVALCRERPMQREFEDHDFVWVDMSRVMSAVEVFGYVRGYHRQTTSNQEWIWLPRLDQLLDLLAAEGYRHVHIWPRILPDSWECEAMHLSAARETTAESSGTAYQSREEAVLTLLLKIRDRVRT